MDDNLYNYYMNYKNYSLFVNNDHKSVFKKYFNCMFYLLRVYPFFESASKSS